MKKLTTEARKHGGEVDGIQRARDAPTEFRQRYLRGEERSRTPMSSSSSPKQPWCEIGAGSFPGTASIPRHLYSVFPCFRGESPLSRVPVAKTCLCVLTAAFLVAGVVSTLGPVTWRWGKRTIIRMQARHQWGAWCAGDRRMPQDGEPAAWLTIPACEIDNLVLTGGSKSNLEKSICAQAVGTSAGALRVFSGHRDTHFRRLRYIKPGYEFTVADATGTVSRFRVADIDTVERDAVEEHFAGHRHTGWIALMTCYPFRYMGPAPERFIVWGAPVGR